MVSWLGANEESSVMAEGASEVEASIVIGVSMPANVGELAAQAGVEVARFSLAR